MFVECVKPVTISTIVTRLRSALRQELQLIRPPQHQQTPID